MFKITKQDIGSKVLKRYNLYLYKIKIFINYEKIINYDKSRVMLNRVLTYI